MPRKPNYDFEKRKREQAREAKRDAKLEEKQRRKAEAERAAPPPIDEGTPPATR